MKKLIATLSALTFAAGVFAAEAPAPTGSAPAAKSAATAKASLKKHPIKKVKKAAPKTASLGRQVSPPFLQTKPPAPRGFCRSRFALNRGERAAKLAGSSLPAEMRPPLPAHSEPGTDGVLPPGIELEILVTDIQIQLVAWVKNETDGRKDRILVRACIAIAVGPEFRDAAQSVCQRPSRAENEALQISLRSPSLLSLKV